MNEFVIVFSKVVLRLGKTTTLYTITDEVVVGYNEGNGSSFRM